MTTTYPEHERLKMELRLRGTSLSRIAAQIGVLPGSVTAVSQGIRRSKRIEEELASAVGTTPEELFPERYKDREATRRPKTIPENGNDPESANFRGR